MTSHELIFVTNNPDKILQDDCALQSLAVKVRGIHEFGIALDVPEDGPTALDNARAKALAYAAALQRPVFSMDNALYLDSLTDEDQPGLHVRRIPGATERPSDEELLAHYSQLIAKHGGQMTGRWEFAVAIALPTGQTYEAVIISPRLFTSHISPKRINGYPLESIQIDPATNNYVAEMTAAEQDTFWQRSIGVALANFVQRWLMGEEDSASV